MTRWTRALAVIAMLAPALPAAAQNYPSRPIRAIASQGAGGLSDLFMRALGQDLGPALGTSIVVEDRAGAEGTIGAKACAESAPDGYTICILPDQAFVTNPFLPGADSDPMNAPDADRATVLPHPDFRGERFAGRQIVRRARETRQVQARHIQLHGALGVEGRLHGAASTKRTAPTSCACRSRAAAMPSPACSTAPRKSPSSASAI